MSALVRRPLSEADLALLDGAALEAPPHARRCDKHGWFRAAECVRCDLERRGDTKREPRWRKGTA